MENVKKKSGLAAIISGPLTLAALMFSVYVGPGFASGTQTVSYFLTKGWIGVFVGPIVVGIITFIWCWMTFEFNRIYRPKDYRQQSDMIYKNKFLRHALGIFTDILGILQIIMVTAAMVSGAANLFKSMWNIPMLAGTLIFALAILVLTLKGSKLVLSTGNFLTCCIIAVTIIIAIIAIAPTWDAAMDWMNQRVEPEEFGFSKIYAWYVIITFINTFASGRNAAVPACLETLRTKKDSMIAALGTAMLCVLATLVYTVIFAAGMPEIASESIPTLYTLQELAGVSTGAQILYVVIALAAMLSTGVGLLYGGIARFENPVKKIWTNASDVAVRAVISIAFIVISTALSKFGIINIIGVGYTWAGIISVPILIFLLFFTIPHRIWRDKKDGTYPLREGEQ